MPRELLKLGSKDEVFDTFTKLHPYLKENFFLQTKEEDSDPYESSQFSVVIANASGIYGLYSYREVFEFKEFWGIGSGRSFALGAMHAVYDKAKIGARGRARPASPRAASSTAIRPRPVDVFTLKMKEVQMSLSRQVKVPDIGDFDEVAVIEVLVKPGDTVKAEQSLITVESRQGLDGDSVDAMPAWSRS